MDLITNPWFITLALGNIIILIFMALKYLYFQKDEPLLFDRLRDAGIHTTVRIPPQKDEVTEGDQTENS